MKDLIKIEKREEVDTVNARELHTFLESKQQFTDWIKKRIEQYDFIENEDYIIFSGIYEKIEKGRGRPSTEYFLTLDMAKELAMVENNSKGKLVRRWFIQKQKELAAIRGYHLMNSREVARYLGVSMDTVQKYSRLGHLAFIWMGPRRMYRFDDIKDYLDRNYVPAQAELPFEDMARTVAFPSGNVNN